jgi:SWI/SNF-related matrix-associated actin-dependent regulator 1 of chromatin subfamily A
LILDESHFAKDQKAKRTQKCFALSKVTPNVILLTGTPVMNRPREAFSQVQLVDPRLFPSFWDYARRYCDAKQEKIRVRGGRGATRMVWNTDGASNLSELNDILRKRVMIRRRKEDVLKDLPEKRRMTIPLALKSERLAEYRTVARDVVAELRKAKRAKDAWKTKVSTMPAADREKYLAAHAEEASKAGKMTALMVEEISKLRISAARAKMEEAVEYIVDLQDQAGKVLVFAHHHAVIDMAYALLCDAGVRVVTIDGRTGVEDRQKAIDAFQTGDVQVAVLGITAAGIGLTLTAASDVVFIEFPWRPTDIEQAEARVWRLGQKNAVTSRFLVALGTIEDRMMTLLDSKSAVVNATLGEGQRTLDEDGILDALVEDLLKGKP